MEKSIVRDMKFLRKLSSASRYQRHQQLGLATKSQIQTLHEIAYGIHKGRIPLKPQTKRLLKNGRYVSHIRDTASRKLNICDLRGHLVHHGGWLEVVLPEVLSYIKIYMTTPKNLRHKLRQNTNASDDETTDSENEEDGESDSEESVQSDDEEDNTGDGESNSGESEENDDSDDDEESRSQEDESESSTEENSEDGGSTQNDTDDDEGSEDEESDSDDDYPTQPNRKRYKRS